MFFGYPRTLSLYIYIYIHIYIYIICNTSYYFGKKSNETFTGMRSL